MTTPVATLYTFGGSLWASVPRIGLVEKGYSPDECVLKDVDLLKGQNFDPNFLRINPKGSLPALVVPLAHTVGDDVATKFKALTDSIEILEFLDTSRKSVNIGPSAAPAPSLSPATIDAKAKSDRLIELVHAEMAPDGNLLLLSARDDAEIQTKSRDVPLQFLKGRQEALEKYSSSTEGATNALKAFYADRLKENGTLLSIYQGKADQKTKQAFFEKSQQAWAALPKTLQKLADSIAAHRGTFLLGEQLSLADVHAGAWLARILAVAGAKSVGDPKGSLAKLQDELGGGAAAAIPPQIVAFWTALAARDSFAKVYADGLH